MSNDTITVDDEPIVTEEPINAIEFNPPIDVNPLVIAGGAVVTRAIVESQPDPTQVVASLSGTGFQNPLVIGVPFVTDPETSIRIALS